MIAKKLEMCKLELVLFLSFNSITASAITFESA